jgi:hypothetical protein
MMILCSSRRKACDSDRCIFKHTILLDHAFEGASLNFVRRMIQQNGYITITCGVVKENVRVYSVDKLCLHKI